MGRTLKRVPLAFSWPLNKKWDGYLNPYYVDCPACNGSGQTMGRRRLEDLVSLIMLSGDDARRGDCHPHFGSTAALYYSAGKVPSLDLAELTEGLAGRGDRVMGHDASDKWAAVRKVIEAAGLDDKVWGWCTACAGVGVPPEDQKKVDAWTQTHPPEGPGYQLWETTSEGSPQSPVFETLDALCEWCAANATTFGRFTASAEEWRKMLGDDHVYAQEGNRVFL